MLREALFKARISLAVNQSLAVNISYMFYIHLSQIPGYCTM